MRDLKTRLSGGSGPRRLQWLSDRVPGFAGYSRKETRREADRLLRVHISDRLLEQRRKLENLQAGLVNANRLAELPAIEAGVVKLNTLADEIRTASYGYAGWLDVATVEEPELEALYEYDLALAEATDWVAHNVNSVSQAIAAGDKEAFHASLADLDATLDRLAAKMLRRRDAVLDAKRSVRASPRSVLGAGERVAPAGAPLPLLDPGDALSHGGHDYLVVGRVTYRQTQGKEWHAYLLRNAEERWLWVMDQGRKAYLSTPVPPPEVPPDATSLPWQDEEMVRLETGRATADIEGSAGRQSDLATEYRRFASPSGRLLWIERWGEEESAYFGEPISPEELEFWQKGK